MPKNPEHLPDREIIKMPFLLSSRFDSRETSQAPYDAIQNIVRTKEVDFSVFRLIQNWSESLSKAPPSQKRNVVVLGKTPPEPIARQVTEAIHMGKQVDIPDEAIYQRLVTAVRTEGIEHRESLDTEGAQAYTAI